MWCNRGGGAFEGGSPSSEISLTALASGRGGNGQVGAEGEIGVDTPDKTTGLRIANLTVSVNDGNWAFRGGAALPIPGVEQTTIGVQQTDNGLILDGDVSLAVSSDGGAYERRGMLSGNATVGATNRTVGEDVDPAAMISDLGSRIF